MTKDGAFLSSCQAGAALGANRLSSKSLASDSTAIRFTLAAQPPAQHTLPLSAAATPEVCLSLHFSHGLYAQHPMILLL